MMSSLNFKRAVTFNEYKEAVMPALFVWGVLFLFYFLYGFIFGLIEDTNVILRSRFGFSIFINILIGGWIGKNLIDLGGEMGDSIVTGVLTGLVMWILIFIFFGVIQDVAIRGIDFDENFMYALLAVLFSTMGEVAVGAAAITAILLPSYEVVEE